MRAREGPENLRYPVPIVIRGFRLLTIRTRLGRGEVGSFSPRLPSAPSFLPSSRAETLIVELRARGTVKFCGADKGAIQIKRSPFPTPPVLVLLPCATLPSPPAAFSSPSLSVGVSWCNPYPSSRLFRSAVAFRNGCFSPGFSTNPSSRQPPGSFLRRVYEVNDRKVKDRERERTRKREDRKRERESRTYSLVLSMLSSTFISGIANPRHPSWRRLRNSCTWELSAANPRERARRSFRFVVTIMDLVKESTSDKLEALMSNKKQVHSFMFIIAAMSTKKFESCLLSIANT